jgi:hypothetical protein
MILIYLALIELGKRRFYRAEGRGTPLARPRPPRQRRIHHRTSRWTTVTRPHRPAHRARAHDPAAAGRAA